MKTEFTADWKDWIETNIQSGKDRDGIFKVLHDEGYEYSAIVNEMNYRPSRAIEDIQNPLKAAQVQNNGRGHQATPTEAYKDNHGLAIPKSQIYVPNGIVMESDDIDLRLVDGFLNAHECETLIEIIKQTKRPSTVGNFEIDKNYRTSQTCDMGQIDDPRIKEIDNRICKLIGIHPAFSESIQGQYYEVGQEFKAHTDFFDMEEFDTHCKIGGQRTYTVMIYLNDVEEGGETEFKRVNVKLKPMTGMAVIWNSLNPDGTPNHHTLHQAHPIKKGYKAIITKWFRTSCPQPGSVNMLIKERNEHIPSYTDSGLHITRMPKPLFEKVNDFYHENRKHIEHEFVEGDFIVADKRADKKRPSSSSLVNMPPEMRDEIHASIKPAMEAWCGKALEPTFVYGIREYHHGAILKMHRDRYQTHIISAIINVDQETEIDWPLCIEDNYYRKHRIMLKPGEVVFYEGGRLLHGRPFMFEGKSFANLFCHFKPVDYVPPVLAD